jgi:putative membrane protein
MRKVFLLAAALMIGVAVTVRSPSQAQPFYGPGMMRGFEPGWVCFGVRRYGYWGNQSDLNLSADDVKNCLERTIDNPNLKVGEIKEKDADTIAADIVTKDKNGLVQHVEFNRHSGLLATGATIMGYGYGPHWGMMGGWGYGYGFGLIHMVVWVIILIAIIVGIIWLVRSLAATGGQYGPPRRSAGLDVLEERYARGEINRDEYLEKKRDLGG